MTVRVAVVGCGTVARVVHLPGLRAGGDADVVVFASRSHTSAQMARDEWGSGDVTTDWLTAVTRDDVDAVHVCVPNVLHAEVAARALAAGKHVLVEKPITTTVADADELLASAGDRLLGVAFDGRCNPVLRELRRRLPEIGPVRRAEAVLGHGGPQAWSPTATWFRDPALSGGGALIDLGVHVVDAVSWCVGPVVEVRSAALDGPIDGSIEEEATLELVLHGGATARADVSWRAEQSLFAFTVIGERGTLKISDGVLSRDGEVIDVPPVDLHTAAGAFARAIATGAAPIASGADGRAALAVVLAGYACAASGTPQAPG